MQHRIEGLDLARALAIFGMVVVNFRLATGAETGAAWLLGFTSLFEGRASAMFVVLAGVGVSLMTRRACQTAEPGDVRSARATLVRRGLLLFVIGLAYTPIWQADILHYYGLYFLLASLVITVRGRTLLWLALTVVLSFPILLSVLDYEAGWDWATLHYENFWTFAAMVRRLVFNGFHPILPWFAFLLWGLWLGRQDLNDAGVRWRLSSIALAVWVAVEGGFVLLNIVVRRRFGAEPDSELDILTSTAMMPPLPQYVVAAAASATLVILLAVHLAQRWPRFAPMQWLIATGRMSLTLYVAHVILGMGTLEAMGRLGGQRIEFSLLATLVFCVAGVLFSVFWTRVFKSGPLEWGFRKIAG